MEKELVRCIDLYQGFGRKTVLENVNLTLQRGRLIGLVGPNGAGKTTLIKLLNGLLQPSSGCIWIDGQKPGVATHAMVSYLPDKLYFSDWMRVQDTIDFFADFYADFDRAKAEEMRKLLQLDEKQRVKTLSKGMQEKLQLILAMSRQADLYLLDEPLAGVDPATREFILRTIVAGYNVSGTVLISTHLIADLEAILDEVIFLQNGHILLHETTDAIREREHLTVDGYFRKLFRFTGWEGENDGCF